MTYLKKIVKTAAARAHQYLIVLPAYPDIDNDLFFPRFPAPMHTIITLVENSILLKVQRLDR
ncbi:MAG: hypothetical protein AAF720_15525 [Pseudomonadota bacterium]